MKQYVVPLADVDGETAAGGKAHALGRMLVAGMPVPDGFVVLPTAFDASGGDRIRCADGKAAAAIADLALAADVRSQIDAALATQPDARWAVRSSAREEDGTRDSFAGQLDSFVDIAAPDVPSVVARVWASSRGERVRRYRNERGLDARGSVPGVIVQRMVEGDVSGVAFSADPVSGRRGVAVVAATAGRAGALVQGDEQGESWRVSRTGGILERPNADALLCERDVLRVAALARDAQRLFGTPQDVEWTIARGAIHVLQSRPITTLASQPDPDAPRAIWDNANIVESYAGVTTPLTFSFARHCYEHVYRSFCALVGVPAATIAANADVFRCMLGLHRGRVFYNLASWYRMLALLPGFASNRRFMEQMMGVREPLPDDVLATAALRAGRVRATLALATTLATMAWRVATLRSRMRAFNARLDGALGERRPDLSLLRPDELGRYYRRLETTLLLDWDAPIVNDFATMVFHGLVRRLSARWLGDARGDVASALLAGRGGFVSEEPARRVRELALLVREDRAGVTALVDAPRGAIQRELARRPAIARAFDAYVERFGERCVDELKLESATLVDDPLPLYRAVGALAARRTQPPAHDGGRAGVQTYVRERLRGHPLRRATLRLALSKAREHLCAREDLRFERTRVFGRARQIFVELGRRLADLDLIAQPADVFYLEVDEILAIVENRAASSALAGVAQARRAEFAAFVTQPPPGERFETRGIACRGHAFASPERPTGRGSATLAGTGCCPGVVRGVARVVRDPRSTIIRDGDIVVAERTDPGWVTVFPLAKGLLVERGSLLSHSAIIARELGLPTIVGLPGVTAWLRDGDAVEMDGASGVVVRLATVRDDAEIAAH